MGETIKSALHHLFDEFYRDAYALNPLQATFDGVEGFNDQLPAEDQAYWEHLYATYHHYKSRLQTFNKEVLDDDDIICYEIMDCQIQTVLNFEPFDLSYMPLNQFTGLHLYMPMLGSGTSVQPFNTVQDYNNWLARCKAFVRWTQVAIENMRAGIRAKIVLPKALVLKIIPQLEALTKLDDQCIFYGPTKNYPVEFSSEDRRCLDQGFKDAIENYLVPSFHLLLVFLRDEYLAHARSSDGMSGLPNGLQLYQQYIYASVTRYEDPEAIYQLGLTEVERITVEMHQIKDQIGFEGSLLDLFAFMKTDPQFYPFETEEAVLSAYQSVYDRIAPNLPKYFNMRPKSAFEIRKTEDFRAASASAEYVPGDLSSGRPGVFYVPIINPREVNVTNDEMESLFLHEAIPGHHYQISIQYENTHIPKLRQKYWSSAFGEGWALYCESLGQELGVLTDPYHQLGALGAEMHRAIRLVVDTGLHMGKMTREQAIAYNMQHEPISKAAATAEIERYMAWPGQALSYKIGELKIKQLRDRYKDLLGDGFNLRDFHDTILKGGVMPLDTFEKYMDRWATTRLR